MKILVITPYLAYPGNDGGSTSMFNFIKNISQHHDVAYVTFARQQDLVHLPKVAEFCVETTTVPLPGGEMTGVQKTWYFGRRVLANLLSLTTFTPVVVQKCISRRMSLEIRRAVERHKPDVVHIFFPQMAHYIEVCGGVPAVMDTSDAALLGVFRRAMNARRVWAKAYHLLQWLFWVRYESRYFPRFQKVMTVTQQDAGALKMVMPDLDVYAAAIAVDVDPLPPVNSLQGNARRIGFLASFNHQPNLDAALYCASEILPLVKKRLPDAEFVVAGKNPPPLLLEMKARGVTCLGFVERVSEFYGDVDVVVAPIRFGGGIKIKVLEAMACGKPVVSTSVGAEGIVESDGGLLVANGPEEFASHVVALLSDGNWRAKLGAQARQVVERRFSWQRVCDDVGKIYEGIIAKRQ